MQHPHRDYEENHYSQRYETTYVEVSFIKQAFSNLVSFLEHYGYFVVLAGFLAYFAFRAAQRFMAERQVTHVQQVIDVDKFHEARKRQQEQHQAITAAKQLELAKRQEEVRAKKLAEEEAKQQVGEVDGHRLGRGPLTPAQQTAAARLPQGGAARGSSQLQKK